MQRSNPTVALLQGPGTSLVLGDGAVLWAFSGATVTNAMSPTGSVGAVVTDDPAGECFPATSVRLGQPLFASSPLGSEYLIAPLDMVRVARDAHDLPARGDAIWAYYQLIAFDSSAPLGVKVEGTGVAPYDDATGQFVPTANILWAGDALPFGSSAVAVGSEVYTYACASDMNGNPVCYGARVEGRSIADPGAYEFARGAGFYTSDVTAALPVLDGPGSLSVRLHRSGRWLATYVAPLDSVVKVRSALTPFGPFSEEHELFTCQLGKGDFCTGGNQHPEVDPTADTIAVSYAAATFSEEGAGSRYWPRLAFVTLPESLP